MCDCVLFDFIWELFCLALLLIDESCDGEDGGLSFFPFVIFPALSFVVVIILSFVVVDGADSFTGVVVCF